LKAVGSSNKLVISLNCIPLIGKSGTVLTLVFKSFKSFVVS
jgi:hypothetical protein